VIAKELKLRKLDSLLVTVTVTRELRARMWLAMFLIRCGVRILGAECKVDSKCS